MKNSENNELIINCKCGCDEGIHLKIYDYEDGDYTILTFSNGHFYTLRRHSFIEKIKKIWSIIRNKDFYYSDILMTKDEFEEFKRWVNSK